MDQHGTLSENRRKQYQYKVPQAVFDAPEQAYTEVIDISDKGDKSDKTGL
jgi:hypothetical protein